MKWYFALAVVAVGIVAARVGLWYLRAVLEWFARPRPDRVSLAIRERLLLERLREQG